MKPPISAVVRIAKSPEQAKLFVALLAGEGIPAHVEGEGLADEFAMSRRLMNLSAVRVLVPTASLTRARDVLAEAQVEDSELERQALAVDTVETRQFLHAAAQHGTPPAAAPPRRNPWLLIAAIAAAAVFFALWMREVERRLDAEHPFFAYDPFPGGMREIERASGRTVASYHDDDQDGIWDRCVIFGTDGKVVATNTDQDHDGFFDRIVELRETLAVTWIDEDGDRRFDICEVADQDGRIVQKFVWKAGGYVLEQR